MLSMLLMVIITFLIATHGKKSVFLYTNVEYVLLHSVSHPPSLTPLY